VWYGSETQNQVKPDGALQRFAMVANKVSVGVGVGVCSSAWIRVLLSTACGAIRVGGLG
jgi:hypothetical protein